MKRASQKSPGRAERRRITLLQLQEMFPDEDAARRWFESIYWPNERCCGHCGSVRTTEASHAKMPYWCTDCRSYFSVKTGTALASSKVPLRKWAIAIYLEQTGLKGISSMKLKRDIGVSQPTAWFMLHRIREAWNRPSATPPFNGPVEVDETHVGGRRRNMSARRRESLTGRGAVAMTAVAGVRDREINEVRAQVVDHTDAETLQGFVRQNTRPDAMVYSDDAGAYRGVPRQHETVRHSVGEYVREQAHTNGIESFWAVLKRAHKGTFHKISPKHLHRYVLEFAGKHNLRSLDTREQMAHVASALIGKRLLHRDLIADNGLSAGGR